MNSGGDPAGTRAGNADRPGGRGATGRAGATGRGGGAAFIRAGTPRGGAATARPRLPRRRCGPGRACPSAGRTDRDNARSGSGAGRERARESSADGSTTGRGTGTPGAASCAPRAATTTPAATATTTRPTNTRPARPRPGGPSTRRRMLSSTASRLSSAPTPWTSRHLAAASNTPLGFDGSQNPASADGAKMPRLMEAASSPRLSRECSMACAHEEPSEHELAPLPGRGRAAASRAGVLPTRRRPQAKRDPAADYRHQAVDDCRFRRWLSHKAGGGDGGPGLAGSSGRSRVKRRAGPGSGASAGRGVRVPPKGPWVGVRALRWPVGGCAASAGCAWR